MIDQMGGWSTAGVGQSYGEGYDLLSKSRNLALISTCNLRAMKAEDWRDQMLHSSRAILALNGTLMIILGGAFWMFPEFFTLSMFPDFAENQQVIDVGVALRKNMGAGCAFIGVILFSCQSSPKSTAQRLLFSSAIGFLLMVTALLQVKLSGQADVPLFILIFFSALCVLSLFVASRRYQE